MRTPILTLLCLSLLAPCTASAACGPNIPGNLTGDCRVNFNDFAILAAEWLIPPNDCPPNYPPCDLNLDCSVDSLDLGQMAVHWLQSCMGQIPTDLSGDCKVNLNDFAIMASDWLQTSDLEGETVWIARYNGPGNDMDWAEAIAIDSNDNIYVTGMSSGSGTSYDYATIKYSPDSNEPVWVARYNNGGDGAFAIAIDSNDNIYVTGMSSGSGTSYDYATIKYSPDSNQPVWVARYNGPGNYIDLAQAIVVDSNDNIYVTGWSDGSAINYPDYATIKYSPDSNQPVWVARYSRPGNSTERARAIAVDSNDNVYVTGSSYITIKYAPDSNQQVWVARYHGPGAGFEMAEAIAVDSNDNIYVTGYSAGSDTSHDYATIKYSPDSNEPVWVARYNGPGNSWDISHDIAVDSNDNIYVTGYSDGFGTYGDFATIKYSADSNQPVWVARYTGPSQPESSTAIAIDSSDNIYVTGNSKGSGTYYDYTTIKYSPDSNQPVWVARYNGPGNSSDIGNDIAIDSNDNIYVTGYSSGSGTSDDYATIKYSPDHTCTPQITGDFDLDCDVDIYDLEIFCQYWLDCNLDPPQDCWQQPTFKF